MKESDLNGLLVKSFKALGGWAYKIPDPPKVVAEFSRKRPFDICALKSGKAYYIESKLLKDYQSFSFSKIEEHQFWNLERIANNKDMNFNVFPVIAVGVWISRKEFSVYFFDIDFILKLKNAGKKSILKKELLTYRENGYNVLKKDVNGEKIFDLRFIPIISSNIVNEDKKEAV